MAQVKIITPRSHRPLLGIAELVRHRRVLYFLVWRDIKVRYKQTALGAAWAVVHPLINVVVLTFVFHSLANVQSGAQGSYAAFTFGGVLPWTVFAASASRAAGALIGNAHLLGRYYFPRLALPLAACGAPLVDAMVGFVVYLILAAATGQTLAGTVAVAPLVLFMSALWGSAVGIALSAAVVWIRDIRQVLPLLFQAWMLATPVGYPASLVPDKYAFVIALNPMVGPVETFRALATGGPLPAESLVLSAVALVAVGVPSLLFFRAASQRCIDVI